MKRLLLLFSALCAAGSIAAQDRIVRTDDTTIEAKVLEITPDAVRYKRFSNPDGPTYVLPVGDIRYIQYVNGEREQFAAEPKADQKPAPVAPVAEVAAEPVPAAPAKPAEAPAPGYVLKTYQVGDYYERDGVRGVVCTVTDDGLHGLILSLDEISLHWDVARKAQAREVGATDKSDGLKNMETVARYIEDNHLTWNEFPAFKWCRNQGEGWYLPSIDEWLAIGFNFNGGTRHIYNRPPRVKMNDALKLHGGKRLDGKIYYFSSTEQDARTAFCTHLGTEPPYLTAESKSGITFSIRAVHRF